MVANGGNSVVANEDDSWDERYDLILRQAALYELWSVLSALQMAGHDLRQQNTPQGLAMLITGVRVTDDGRYEVEHE